MTKSHSRIQALSVGLFFAVPINAKYAVGVVARHAVSSGIIFAYYFSGLWDALPSVVDLPLLKPEDAIYALRSGDRPLRERRWPIIGTPSWSEPAAWPFPEFHSRILPQAERVMCTRFSEDDLLTPLTNNWRPVAEAVKLPDDGVAGGMFIEVALERRLRQK